MADVYMRSDQIRGKDRPRDYDEYAYNPGGEVNYGRRDRGNGGADGRPSGQYMVRASQPPPPHQFGKYGGFEMPVRISSISPPSIYEIDHLVTFDVGTRTGVESHADGMRKLRQMESSSGVWTSRVLLSIDAKELAVTEKATGKELESFPINQIVDPVGYTDKKVPDNFNNLLIFISQKDSWTRTPSTMNIFQCIGISAEVIAAEIQTACEGKFQRIMPIANIYTQQSAAESAAASRNGNGSKGSGDALANVPVTNKVAILNSCFDEIEDFITRLQRSSRTVKDASKKNTPIDQKSLVSKREFFDILQKFKLSLNLIVELQDMLRNPDAMELMHSMFSPLELLVNVCRDASGQPKFVEYVLSPLCTKATVVFLETHLSDSELRLWRSLGNAWTVPREEWSGPAPAVFIPKFRKSSTVPKISIDNASTGSSQDHTIIAIESPEIMPNKSSFAGEPEKTDSMGTDSTAQQTFLNELKARQARVCVVTRSRQRKNERELTVTADEFVELLDNSKQWWRVCNSRGETGFAPNTILRSYPEV